MVVGITGGVGSGKTAFARFLRDLGAHVIEADEIARKLVDEKEELKNSLRTTFGSDVFDKRGRLRRRLLGRIAFSNSEKLDLLNRIFWPPLVSAIEARIEEMQKVDNKALIVVDAAILFEAGMEALFDIVVVVHTPSAKRLKWLSNCRDWSREEVLRRVKSQMDEKESMRRADIVIENAGSLDTLRRKAVSFINDSACNR
ncbi:MAG: dephospho-CoA kinase [bacterium]